MIPAIASIQDDVLRSGTAAVMGGKEMLVSGKDILEASHPVQL